MNAYVFLAKLVVLISHEIFQMQTFSNINLIPQFVSKYFSIYFVVNIKLIPFYIYNTVLKKCLIRNCHKIAN